MEKKKPPMGQVDRNERVQTKATRPIGRLFRPIFGLTFFGLMAEIGHYFLPPFKNSALYFRPSDFRPTVIQSLISA